MVAGSKRGLFAPCKFPAAEKERSPEVDNPVHTVAISDEMKRPVPVHVRWRFTAESPHTTLWVPIAPYLSSRTIFVGR
jgi:hypothetical protein